MILLVWSSEKAQECATAIEKECQRQVRVVSNLETAYEEFKKLPFFAVVIDQNLWDRLPSKAGFLLRHLGNTMPIVVNFAISNTERVLQTVRNELDRLILAMEIARQNACAILSAELKDELTALFLACGIAIQEPTLGAPALEQLKRIEEIARRIRQKLRDSQKLADAAHA